MECKDCQVEMEKGVFDGSCWFSGDPQFGKNFLVKRFGWAVWPSKRVIKFVRAYRCPNCKKIELYTEE